eukprot:827076_1
MDAQQLTFNQDPEASTTDIGPEDSNNSNCCCNLLCCPCKLFYWYISPLTCELFYTLKCLIFHPLNFAIAMFLCIWDATMIPLSIGLVPLCCMGFPLLWVSMEFIIAFSRIDLGFHYYLAESSKKFDKSRAYLLSLSLYFTDIPLCCCYNNNNENCANLMFERMKSLFTSIEMYKYILYHIFIRPIITFSTCWIIFIVFTNIGLIGFPFWYLVNDTMFHENKVILAWAHDCEWPDNQRDTGVVCDKDYIWIINTFERALWTGIISLLVLPLVLRLNNWFANLNKIIAYKFYTFYYTKDIDTIQVNAPILRNTHVRIDSV